ncbi:MAG: hypothetical protein Q8J76_01435 [Desulfobulbaceae bacterium]|nr:hypothetical protein [Desulfobulbaceae bacterium]
MRWQKTVTQNQHQYKIIIPKEWAKKHLIGRRLSLFIQELEDDTLQIMTEEQWYEQKIRKHPAFTDQPA